MNITEANAANIVLRELYTTTSGGDWSKDKRPSRAELHEASKLLANRSHQALGAGVMASQITPRRFRNA